MFFEGQKVRFVNDTGWGRVLKLEGQRILVRTNHGFENWYTEKEIVPEKGLKDMKLSVNSSAAREKIMADKKNAVVKKTGNKQKAPEIDLHIENLLDNWQRLSNYDILQYQLRHFRKMLDRYMEQRQPRVIVIHGKGEGVLRNEIRMELLKYTNIEFLDGSYLEYGGGATEILIRYSGKY